MKLDFNSIKSAVSGAVRVDEENGAIRFFRFNENQEEFIKLNSDQIRLNYEKSLASASVKLDFYSDTENLKLSVNTYIATLHPVCFVDVLIDGELFAHEGYTGSVDGRIDLNIKLSKNRKRITVYFPNLFRSDVVNFEIDDCAEFTPYENKRKFLFFGDSITQGYTAEYPSKSYANRISRYFDASALNDGIGGAFFNAGIIDTELGFMPDLIFVAYGTNDWSKNHDVKKNSKEFVKRLKACFPQSKMIGITPIWRGNAESRTDTVITFNELQTYLKSLYTEIDGFYCVDGLELVPHSPEYFIPDVLHPNDTGFKFYAENLIKKIKEFNIL